MSRRCIRKENISCFFVISCFHSILLNLVDCLHQGFNVQVGVNTFGERHGTGVSNNLLNHGLIHMRFCQHGDTGVSGVVGRVVEADLLHQGCKIAVIIVSVVKVLLVRGMQKVFAFERSITDSLREVMDNE